MEIHGETREYSSLRENFRSFSFRCVRLAACPTRLKRALNCCEAYGRKHESKFDSQKKEDGITEDQRLDFITIPFSVLLPAPAYILASIYFITFLASLFLLSGLFLVRISHLQHFPQYSEIRV